MASAAAAAISTGHPARDCKQLRNRKGTKHPLVLQTKARPLFQASVRLFPKAPPPVANRKLSGEFRRFRCMKGERLACDNLTGTSLLDDGWVTGSVQSTTHLMPSCGEIEIAARKSSRKLWAPFSSPSGCTNATPSRSAQSHVSLSPTRSGPLKASPGKASSIDPSRRAMKCPLLSNQQHWHLTRSTQCVEQLPGGGYQSSMCFHL